MERVAGVLSVAGEAELRRHLARCERCAAELRWEEALARDLAALRGAAPRRVEVRGRVLREIAAVRPDRRDVSPRQLGWAAAGVALMVVVLLAAGAVLVPSLPDGVRESRAVVAGLAAAAKGAARPLAAVLPAVDSLARVAANVAGAAVVVMKKLEPAAPAAVGLAFLIMASIASVAVGRDLRTVPSGIGREER